ncbi:MAG: pyridoxal-dependent decarboxylase [Gemmatimonadota bacterium]|nr:pyridoxal-dependent decarboxylase [Gemmatimonadota bacterium]
MNPEEFRRRGREAVDWVADYMERVEDFPVRSRVDPGETRSALPDEPPEDPESFGALLADLDETVLPGVTHWQSPNFFAYFPSNHSGPSILADLISSGLGVQGMLWSTSPACTELEMQVVEWLVGMLGLPDAFRFEHGGGGVIQHTASDASLCAIVAARERATGGEANERGAGAGGELVAYTSAQAHSSIEKGIKIAGIGRRNLRLVPVDDAFAMRPDALEEAIRDDLSAGRVPFFVTATVGTTSSLAVDPVAEVGSICREHDLWLHVDAAMAGTAALCPEHRGLHEGLELADSYVFNPHKWMLTNFDCSAFWVRDRRRLTGALSIDPEYLRNEASASGEVVDYRDWHVPLGRRFRALKLWFVIRHYGVEGLRRLVRRHVELARWLADRVGEDPRLELAAPVRLNLVCFRHVDGDEASRELLERLNASGELFLTHTELDGRYVLRLCVGQARTGRRHVEAAWERIARTAGELDAGRG